MNIMRKKTLLLALTTLCASHAAFAQPATLWTRGYPGSQIQGGDVAVDPSGNVFVAAQAPSNAGDFLVLKYDRLGTLLWARTYEGGGAGVDQPAAIAVDGSGNVVVTGSSYGGPATGNDFMTIKYGPAGDTMWVRRYNGTGGLGAPEDAAVGLAVNGAGEVYVAGFVETAAGGEDVCTIKYSAAGDTLWTNLYDFAAVHGADRPRAIALDNAGRVVVVGQSWGGIGSPPGSAEDYLLLKYAPNGGLLQVRRQAASPGAGADVAHAVAIDNGNNIFVTGEASQSNNAYAATFRFSASADSLWVRNDPAGGIIGKGIVADGARGVVVGGDTRTGDVFLTRYQLNSGDSVWNICVDGGETEHLQRMGVDAAGDVYFVGTSDGQWDSRMIVARYSTAGQRRWLQYYGGGAGGATGCAVRVIAPGQLVATGSSLSAGEVVTVRYAESSTGAADESPTRLPTEVVLAQNYPNPFNPETRVVYALPAAMQVRLAVYDVMGREVAVLDEGMRGAGEHVAEFDARGLASGVYLCRLQLESGSVVRRMILSK